MHDLRRITDAIPYVNRTGVQWRYLPHDFPAWQTVYSYYAAWEKEGLTARLHEALRVKRRLQARRSPRPHANVPETDQGIDAGKKIKGRKRHIVTDFLGLVLAVIVTAASVSDTAGGRALVDQIAASHPSVAELLVDNGYQRSVIERGEAVGIDVTVTQKPGGVKGFQPTVRWAVEQNLRLVHAAPTARPPLRDPARTSRDTNPMDHDRPDEQTPHRTVSGVLATTQRNRHRDLNQN